MLSTLLEDFATGLKGLSRHRLFSLMAVLILAFGLGTNVTVFSLVDSILLEPLDYPEASRLVQVWEFNQHSGERSWVYYGNYADWKERTRTFDEMALYNLWEANIWGDPEAERVKTAWVSANYFELLGAKARRGRTFEENDEVYGQHRVAVVSHSLWQRRFGGEEAVLGKSLQFEETPFEIVGVLPPGFRHPGPPGLEQPELFLPSLVVPASRDQRSGYTWERVIGRLKPGVSLTTAQRDLDRVARELEAEYPATNRQRGVEIEPLQNFVVGNLRAELRFLLLAVGLVLLLVCANLSGLVTVRSAGRRREMAVRRALGARRRRLVRQMVVESLLLALLGGTLGILLAAGATSILRSSSLMDLPRLDTVSLDSTAVVYASGLTLVGVALFGFLPALTSLRGAFHPHLKAGSRGSGGGRSSRWQRFLVSAEVALALMLVLGAGLLSRSYQKVLASDPGFRPEGVVAVDLTQGGERYEDKEERVRVWEGLTDRLLAQPGVEAVGGVSLPPLLTHDDAPTIFEVEGRPPVPQGQESIAELVVMTAGYKEAMGLRLTEGRDLLDSDRAETVPVVLVNETLAASAWPGESAVGKRLRLPRQEEEHWVGDASSSWLTVVGVVSDVRLFGLDVDPVAEIYRPHAQDPWTTMTLVVKSTLEPSALASILRREVRALDPNQPLRRFVAMSEIYDGALARRRLLLWVLSSFAATALFLAALGIYGVLAWSVSQRTREIGLRMAVGASDHDILRMVLAQSGRLFAWGVAFGMPLSLLLTQAMAGMLFGVGGLDVRTTVGAGAVLLVAALAATLVPAWRASRVDPLVALRDE